LQDLPGQLNDYIRNFTTCSIDSGAKDRALNRAIEYFQRRLTFPSDRRIYKFYFSSDVLYYPLPSGFNEPLGLFYDNQDYNTPSRQWEYRTDLDIVPISGLNVSSRFWGITTINQSNQIIMLGPNINDGTVLDPMDKIGTWTASSDANSLSVDNNVYKEGSGSLMFSITPSSGSAVLQSNFSSGNALDFTSYVQNNGQFKFWVYMPTVNFSNIQFVFGSDSSNYYTGTMTTNADGSSWTANQWNKLGVFFNDMSMTGSPNSKAITFFKIIFNEGSGFSSVSNMRVDYLFVSVPDYMNLVYLSSYKGYVSGSNPKQEIQNFNYNDPNANISDNLYFGDFAPDLIGPVCKRAALELIPQLRQDKDYYMSYKQEVEEWIRIFGRVYPRLRRIDYGKTKLKRSTLR